MSQTDNRPVGELTYLEASDELDAIVANLDSGRIDVDTLSNKFERAIEIVEELESRIFKARAQVDRLLPRLQDAEKKNPPAE